MKHFQFLSSANPYITTTPAAYRRIMRKYRGKVNRIKRGFYLIDDREELPRDLFALDIEE